MDTELTMTAQAHQSLAEVLGAIHQAWIEEARRYLLPVLDPGADFWTRWAAVRYLADDFREHHRHARALVSELRPLLEAGTAERLQRSGDRLFKLRLEVDRIGRRRGTAAEAARASGALLAQLELWCSEIEHDTANILSQRLSPKAKELLAHLEGQMR